MIRDTRNERKLRIPWFPYGNTLFWIPKIAKIAKIAKGGGEGTAWKEGPAPLFAIFAIQNIAFS